MTVKLIVHNIPPGVTQEEFRSKFMELRGFQDSKIMINSNNELYAIVEFATYELADYARKIMSNFTFPNSLHPINIDFYKPQESFDYYPNTMGMNQGVNMSNLPINQMSGSQNIQGSHMNFPSSSNTFHFSNQNMQPSVDIEKNSQGNFISHNTQQSQQFPIENIGHISNDPYNIQSQTQINPSPISSMPLYQTTPQNPMISPNLQQQPIGMHQITPNTTPNQMTHNPSQINPIQNINTQQPISATHNVPLTNMPINAIPSNINTQQINQPSTMNTITEPVHMNPSHNIRNFPQNNMMFFGHQQQQQPQMQNPPPNPINNAMSNFSSMINQAQNPQFNQLQTNFPNIQSQPPNFPSKTLTHDELVMFKVPPNATNSIYVDGIPIDASEREVAHVFRPFPGFQEVRLIKKEAKNGRQFYFCFVDFENSLQSTIALNTLQGYRFDKNDSKGLKISYAFHAPENIKKQSNMSQSQQNKKLKTTKKK